MRIFIKAKPSAKENKIEKLSEDHYIVSVKEPPVQGRANGAIIKILAKHFKTTPINVRIVTGHTARQKIVEIK